MSFENKGYYVNETKLPHDLLEICDDSCIKDTLNIVFNGECIDCNDKSNIKLLIDAKQRENVLVNPNCIWKNGNKGKPYVYRTTGIAQIYYNKEIIDNISNNTYIREIFSRLYEHNNFHMIYPSRFSVRPKGSPDSWYHISSSMLEKHSKHGITCIISGSEYAKNIGSINIIPHFNKFYRIIRNRARESKIKMDKTFFIDKHPQTVLKASMLKDINMFLSEEINNNENYNYLEQYLPLKIQTIDMLPGTMLFIDSMTPYEFTKNTSNKTRTYYIIDTFEGKTLLLDAKNVQLPIYIDNEKEMEYRNNISTTHGSLDK